VVVLGGFFYLLVTLYALEELLPLLFLGKKWKKAQTDYPPLSIIIPVKNEAGILQTTLQRWLTIDYPNTYELIFCDQDSTDHTRSLLHDAAKLYPNVFYYNFPSENKLGALLQGVKKAKYDIIVLSDADRFPNKTSVRSFLTLVPCLEKQLLLKTTLFLKRS
jgi:cellulose synthase/poly-beta-1,6-N-acetylglucosamine synthase-like glycosyltransferase